MNKEQWERAKRLLDDLLEIPHEERAVFLEAQAAEDETVQAFVRRFADENSAEPIQALERGLTGLIRSQAFSEADLEEEYEVLEFLGSGGMGDVLAAKRRDDPSGRRVALKLLSSQIQTDDPRWSQFLREQKIQAGLEHPNIARIYRVGVTDIGRPYLEMELVDGRPIDEHCQDNQLSVQERLTLFQQICAAVQYAHQSLVVHRDLKPGNILVTSSGEVKLLDFGIAKLLGTEGQSTSTETTGLFLTPAYASPEQVQRKPINTLSDVYSLGIVLFELLSGGKRPYELENLSPSNMERVICEQAPATPSQVSVLPDRRHVADDLDRIVQKALRKEPHERYSSVQEFAGDIDRFLAHRPIVAREPALLYSVRKFVRRNALAVTLGCLGIILAGLFLAFQERQRQVLEEEKDRTQIVADFLVELFQSSDPYEQPENLSAREILDAAQERIKSELHQTPAVQVELLLAMSRSYFNLGMAESAKQLAQQAWEIQQSLSQRPERIALSLNLLGLALHNQGKLPDARQHYEEALQLQEQAGDMKGAASTLANLASLTQAESRYEEAADLHRKAIATAQEAWGRGHIETANIQVGLAKLLVGLGQHDEAEPLFAEVLRIRQETYGEKHPRIADAFNNQAEVQRRRGDYDAAKKSLEQAWQMWSETLGPDHPTTAAAIQNLGLVHKQLGQYEEARKLYGKALEIRQSTFRPDHPTVALSLNLLGSIHDDLGEFAQSEELYREALAIQEKSLGPANVSTAITRNNLAIILQHQSKFVLAEEMFNVVLSSLQEAFNGPHPNVALAYDNLGWVHFLQREPDEAEALIRQGLTMARETRPPGNSQIAFSATKLATVLMWQRQCDEAVPLAEEVIEILEPVLGLDHWRVATAQGVLGGCLSQQGRFEEAESILIPSQTLILDRKGAKPTTREHSLRLLVDLYERWKKPQRVQQYQDLLNQI